jgi:NAD(P)-dependent dehydrogenase (short-subunit alcohol dehydrogenase family)
MTAAAVRPGRLDDKVVLITGAAQGIRFATAELAAREAAHVVISDTLSRSETRFRCVSCGFAAGSVAWLGASRGAAIARLPPGEVPVRPAGGAGPV